MQLHTDVNCLQKLTGSVNNRTLMNRIIMHCISNIKNIKY